MSKFKVGDRVRRVRESSWPEDYGTVGKEYDVISVEPISGNIVVIEGKAAAAPDAFEPVAVAPATATLNIEAGKFYKTRDGRKVGPMEEWRVGAFREAEGDGRFWHEDGEGQVKARGEDLVGEWAAPTTTFPHDIYLPFPQVGDAVLIPGVISAINQSPRGTNYNIVFETQNRRMSLHFLEEDFILDECGDDEGDCPCANDNGPDPADTAKAFDALGDWLRAVAINPSAAFRSNKEAA